MSEQVLQGLTNESRTLLEGYLRWSKERRDKFALDMEFEAKAAVAGRLVDTTYNKAEVEDLLQQQLQVLAASVDTFDHHKTITSAGFFHSVLKAADFHRIPLNVSAFEALGNTAAQTSIEQIEQRILTGPKSKLAPLTAVETGGDAGRQLMEANEQIRQLHTRMRLMTDQHAAIMAEKSAMTERIFSLEQALQSTQSQAQFYADQTNAKAGLDHATVAQLQVENARLRSEVAQLTHDINGRLSQSSQFQGLKRIVLEKNEQLRFLRGQLAVYNPALAAQGAGGDDVLIEEDD